MLDGLITLSVGLSQATLENGLLSWREPTPPSQVQTHVQTTCGGKAVSIHYVSNRPGADYVAEIIVGGIPVPADQLRMLRSVVGLRGIDKITVRSCESSKGDYSARLLLRFETSLADREASPKPVELLVKDGKMNIVR
jgi:hypothetical protein